MCSIFGSPSIPKSYIHMVTVFANLNATCDDSSPDEPLFLKEARAFPYWKDFKKAIYAEFQSLIENDTWKNRDTPIVWAVLTGHWVFKIKKDK